MALTGCQVLESGNQTNPTEGNSTASGQTFRVPIRQNPEKIAVYRGGRILKNTAYAAVAKEPAAFNLRWFFRPPGAWTNGQLANPLGLDGAPALEYTWLEGIDITPTEVTVTIREDANWSDGHPITGRDIAVPPIERTLRRYFLPPPGYAPDSRTDDQRESSAKPARVLAAFDGFEIGDKSVAYRSSAGYFDLFYEKTIALWLAPIYPPLSPTHIAPFTGYADAVIETARRAQKGEIYPWFGRSFRDPNRESLIREHLADPKYVEKFSNPDNVPAIGRWDLVAFDGTEMLFKPNSHHWLADAPNFDQVRFEFTRGTQRMRAAVRADRFDFGTLGTTPQSVVDSFPENITILQVPGGVHSGNELRMNFDHPALGSRTVRRAIMYALDQVTIAKNIHPSIAVPVTTPGGDCWNATRYANQQLIDEGFTTYSSDGAKAARLMRSAGYTRDGADGQWVDGDGTALTLTLPTPSDTPKWESTVATQLSEFGINTTVQTLDDAAFTQRRNQGKFEIWPASSVTATGDGLATVDIWQDAATNPKVLGIYPDEQFKTGEFSNKAVPIPRTEDRYRIFTIRAPPVGKPDGSLQEYHPAALALWNHTNPPQAELRRRIKIGMWLANWYLPTIPITKQYVQHFIDDVHWLWPRDTLLWKNFENGDVLSPKGMLGDLGLRANPDNPETEAK